MSRENVEIVRHLMEAFERNDVDAQLGLMDADVELTEWPEGPDPASYRGHAGVIRARDSWYEAWEWLKVEPQEIVDAGERVLLRGRTHAKGKGSSVEVQIDAYNVYTIRDRKVIRMEFFTTREPALRAAGLADSATTSEEAR